MFVSYLSSTGFASVTEHTIMTEVSSWFPVNYFSFFSSFLAFFFFLLSLLHLSRSVEHREI
jgi:hypothetical protein